MDELSISEIARAGMTLERSRLELASMRIAQANIAYSSASEALNAASRMTNEGFAKLAGLNNAEPNIRPPAIRTVSDPSHPLADGNGNIFFVDVDPIHEMATLVSAVRAYEANVRAYNTNSEMNRAALSIGEKK